VIAVDTSSLISFLSGAAGADIDRLKAAAASDSLVLPPPVISELLSKPGGVEVYELIGQPTLIEITEGYWERAGVNRALLLSKGLKAKLADALIAQSCIDSEAPLLTRDADYRHFARWCGLKLALEL
jgi:predicted nucleic acid-binding protein